MVKLTNERGIINDEGPIKFPFGNNGCSTVDVERTGHSTVHPINKSRKLCSMVYCNILNLLLLSFFCVPCFLELSLGETSRPLNRAAVKGERVQLNCSTKETYNGYWLYTKPYETTATRIYDFGRVVNNMTTIFSVNDSVQGSFNLIFNASESTSGRYTCQPDLNTADQSAEVIVLDTAPNCSMIMTSDLVNASCVIDFNGNWAPKIQWRNMNGRLETNDTTTVTVQNSRVTSFLILPAKETNNLTCTPTFVLENKPKERTAATNIPGQSNSCTLIIGSSSDASSEQPYCSTAATPPSSQLFIIVIVPLVALACIIATPFFARFLYKRHEWKIHVHVPKRTSTMKIHQQEGEAMTGPTKAL